MNQAFEDSEEIAELPPRAPGALTPLSLPGEEPPAPPPPSALADVALGPTGWWTRWVGQSTALPTLLVGSAVGAHLAAGGFLAATLAGCGVEAPTAAPPGEPEAPRAEGVISPPEGDTQAPVEDDTAGAYDGSSGGSGGDEPGGELEPWGAAVATLYTFQDNSACNSTMTASGDPLVPYVSVALPFRYLTDHGGGPFSLGETIHVAFLEGRTMPNGRAHSGWVRIDDFCGDRGDDSYCLQGGLPNVDLYVGDWAASGMSCEADDPDAWGSGGFSGPAGDGQEHTTVSFGPAPEGEPAAGYGGAAMGTGDCGDCDFARTVQPPACWHYDPGDENVEYCDCTNSNGRHGECG
ncbi:MAG: hypothetical protein ABIO70_27325 [Pseudomonadota bacterium]